MASLEAPAPRRLHALDGLRAIAATLVVFHHSLTEGVRRMLEAKGFVHLGELLYALTGSGVELFFVLSGVVLLRPYLRKGRPLEPGTYLRRRVERILPPYLAAWALAGAAIVVLHHRPTAFGATLPAFSWPGFLGQAVILRFTDVLYNDAWWSLAVEVLFYVSVPLLLLLACSSRFTFRAACAVLPFVAVGSAVLNLKVHAEHAPWTMFYSLGTYAACFYGGIVIAKFDLPRGFARALAAVGVAVVVGGTAVHPVLAHVGFALTYTGLVANVVHPTAATKSALSHPLLLWLGERSYSFFLVHVTVFQLANGLASAFFAPKSGLYFLVSRALGLPAALFTSMLLFWLVERRFARGLATAQDFWPPLTHKAPPALPAALPVPVPAE